MSLSNNFPAVRPSLLLDFANTKTLDPRITFTRASTGTFYDGKTVAKAEENLIVYSQEFDNAAWAKVSATVTANSTTAPDGTTTADTFSGVFPPASSYTIQAATSVSGLTYTFSVYAKASSTNFLQLSGGGTGFGTNVWANFDLSAGTVGSVGSLTTASIASVGGGWYRCIVVGAATASATANAFLMVPVESSTVGRLPTNAGATSIFIWGAQLEQRSSVTAYTATTTAPITNYIPALQTAAAGVARFEHNPVTGESLGLEIEEQRTNVIPYSTDYSNATYWTGVNFTRTASATVSPDGTLNATLITVNNGTSGDFQTTTYAVTAGVPVTLSFYAKANGFTSFTSREYIATGNTVTWNLSTGVATTNGSMTPVGNGWYRCSWVFTPVTAQTLAGFTIFYQLGGGNGYKGVFLWGAQLEAGSFATSYIPTTTAQVTRSADAASMTGTNFSSWYRADEGSFYGESKAAAASGFLLTVSDGSPANRAFQPFYLNGTTFNTQVVTSGTTIVNINNTVSSILNNNKFSFGYKTNDFAVSLNGGAISSDTSGTPPTVNSLRFGFVDGTTPSTHTIKKLAYYPLRLTNAELQGLTTV